MAGKRLKSKSKKQQLSQLRQRIFNYITSRVLYFEKVANMVFYLNVLPELQIWLRIWFLTKDNET